MNSNSPDEPRIIRHLADSDEGYDARRRDDNVDYHKRYTELQRHLNSELHPNVNTGAAAADSVWLTDHGAKHVATVIQRIDDLTYYGDKCVLSPYETYLVLVAAQFHDVGNLFGRSDHEKRARDIMFDVPAAYLGEDNLEKRLICDIAEAHGGTNQLGERDTIGVLKYDRPIKKLAAILRFADELAEDSARTSRAVIKAIEAGTGDTNVFHLYADRLRRVAVDHENAGVRLTFELLKEHLAIIYSGRPGETYLLDEILRRTLKTHREQVYCGRFMVPHILSDRTDVEILICSARYKEVVARLSYVLAQRGYPDGLCNIRELAPELTSVSGRAAAARCDEIPDEMADDTPIDLTTLMSGGR